MFPEFEKFSLLKHTETGATDHTTIMNNKVYISGKITGLSRDEVEANFKMVEDNLLSRGYEVVNPLKLKHDHDKEWCSYMIEDLQALIPCQSICMIWNWTESAGAKIEHAFAQAMGKHVIYFIK